MGFRSLQETIDTTTSGGKLVFHVFGALAEFERDLVRDRTRAGLKAARARGRLGGRPRALDDRKLALARSLYADTNNSPKDICQTLGISRATLYRYVSSAPRPAPEAVEERMNKKTTVSKSNGPRSTAKTKMTRAPRTARRATGRSRSGRQ